MTSPGNHGMYNGDSALDLATMTAHFEIYLNILLAITNDANRVIVFKRHYCQVNS